MVDASPSRRRAPKETPALEMMDELNHKQKALFVDRDGIFHELVPWGPHGELCAPRHAKEVRRYDAIRDLSSIKSLGFALVMVTNQPDVERGITEKSFVLELNEQYQQEFNLDAAYVSWASLDSDPMKKPNPGMFLKAASDLNLDLRRSFHLGDTERDVEAARRAGCQSILWDRPYNRNLSANFRIHSVSELHAILSTADNTR